MRTVLALALVSSSAWAEEPSNPYHRVTLSPDGRHLAARRMDDTVELYALDPVRQLRVIPPSEAIHEACFDPSGHAVALVSSVKGGWEGVRLDLETGAESPLALNVPEVWRPTRAWLTDGGELLMAAGDTLWGDTPRITAPSSCERYAWHVGAGDQVEGLCQDDSRLWLGVWTPDGTAITDWTRLRYKGELPYLGVPLGRSPDHRVWYLEHALVDVEAGTITPFERDLAAVLARRDPITASPLEADLRAQGATGALAAHTGRGIGLRFDEDRTAIEVFDLATGETRALVASAEHVAALEAAAEQERREEALVARSDALRPAMQAAIAAARARLEAEGYDIVDTGGPSPITGSVRTEMDPSRDYAVFGVTLPDMDPMFAVYRRDIHDAAFPLRYDPREPSPDVTWTRSGDLITVEARYTGPADTWHQGSFTLHANQDYVQIAAAVVVGSRPNGRSAPSNPFWKPDPSYLSINTGSVPATPSRAERVATDSEAIVQEMRSRGNRVIFDQTVTWCMRGSDDWGHAALDLREGRRYTAAVFVPAGVVATSWTDLEGEVLFPNREPAPYGLNRIDLRRPGGYRQIHRMYFNYRVEPASSDDCRVVVFEEP